MKRATILLAAIMATGTTAILTTPPAAQAKHASKDDSSLIKKGMTLDEAEQATNGTATPVGAPNNGVQTYRIAYRETHGDGGVNDHPTLIVFTFGLKNGKVTWVHKQA
jgi:hypothetical protein